MENASKALIIAGTILISVMVLSTAVMLVRMFGNFGNETAEKLEEHKLNEFNNQFLKFVNTKVTAHDIVTLANLAYQNNIDLLDDPSDPQPNATDSNLFVQIKVNYNSGVGENRGYGIENFEKTNQSTKDEFLNKFSIQSQYHEKPNATPNEGLLDTAGGTEPLPVYFLCTTCKVSSKTKRVYYMEFQSYYYKSQYNQRPKREIETKLIG